LLRVAKRKQLANVPKLDELIREIRGQKVMLDADLARIYGIPTFRFNEAIKRNRERFPEDFMFRLTAAEFAALTSQFAIFKQRTWRAPNAALRLYRTRCNHGRECSQQPARCANEYDVRGRRWMDCIGRLVRRPSVSGERESAYSLCARS